MQQKTHQIHLLKSLWTVYTSKLLPTILNKSIGLYRQSENVRAEKNSYLNKLHVSDEEI